MDYREALGFIHGIARFGSKPGLRRIAMLLDRMGNPQDSLRFIHVAGTNGKGSTSAMTSRILSVAGYRTGLFISPYVLDFRERIQLNGKMISESELIKSTELVKSHWDELDAIGETPTEFEVVTAAAMDYFFRMKCDIVVLEAGLGGLLDSTNIIKDPVCSVITSIGFDHQEYMGDTIAEIAEHKCGIIKPHGVTVCYPDQQPRVIDVIAAACSERDNELIIPSHAKVIDSGINGSDIIYGGIDIHVPLIGAHQVLNAVTAIEAVKTTSKSGFNVSAENIYAGIAGTVFPARFEALCEKPLVLLDGAHNPSGAKQLAETLKLLGGRRIHAVICCMSDKDVDGIMKEVLPLCESVTAVSMDIPRAMPAIDTARMAANHCKHVYIAGTLSGAIIQPLAHCKGDDVILIFGSLYFAGEIRPVALTLLKRFVT